MRSPESGPGNKGEGPDEPSRRLFLQGLASVAAFAAAPKAALALTNQELLRNREDEIYFNTLISDPIARQRFRETSTRKETASVLRSIAKTKAPWIEEFDGDQRRMHRGALAFRDRDGVLKGNGTILKIPAEGVEGKDAGKDKFRYLVVTASHVADQVPPPAGTHWTLHREERDVAVRDLSADELARAKAESDALLLPPLQKGGEDITGEVGTVIAHGNGLNAPVRKLYPSRLSPKISTPVLAAMYVKLPEVGKKYLHEADFNAVRMITLPYDEAAKTGQKKDQSSPMNRVSGSAFVYIPKGSKELAFGGLIVSGVKAYSEGVSYDVGFILDHMYVREAIDEHLKGVVR